MKRLAEKTIQNVRQNSQIVPVISDYVSLKKRGRNYIGLCPFHSEKTPSFTVSPEKKIYHCFGCQASGDAIEFVRQMDGLTFTEAVEHIAQKSNITIEYDESSAQHSVKDQQRSLVRDCLQRFKEFYKGQLQSNSESLNYATGRGLSEAIIQQFELGYCPTDPASFEFAQTQGISMDILKLSGLMSGVSQTEVRARFFRRLVFPILDVQGKTIGFGGRITTEQSETAKYLNSEETPFFNKRFHLYGINHAKSELRKKDFCILVEGYMDVLMLHQYGFTNTVASLGTALTSQQAQLISRFTKNVVLAFDSDSAGRQAALRAFEVLKPYEISIYFLSLSEKDPADYVVKYGQERFQEQIDQKKPFFEFYYATTVATYDQSILENKSKIIRAMVPLIDYEKDPITRQQYIRFLSRELDVTDELILAEMKKIRYTSEPYQDSQKTLLNRYEKSQECIIYLIATNLDLRFQIKEILDVKHFNESYREIVKSICESDKLHQELISSELSEDHQSFLSQLLMDDKYSTVDKHKLFTECVAVMKDQYVSMQIAEIKNKLKTAEKNMNETQINDLLEQLNSFKFGGGLDVKHSK